MECLTNKGYISKDNLFHLDWLGEYYCYFSYLMNLYYTTYCWHERVQDADGKSRTTCKRLCEIQLCVGVVVVILVKKLHIAVVDQFGNHWNVGAVYWPSSLQHYGPTGAIQTIRIKLFGHRGLVWTTYQNKLKCECLLLYIYYNLFIICPYLNISYMFMR